MSFAVPTAGQTIVYYCSWLNTFSTRYLLGNGIISCFKNQVQLVAPMPEILVGDDPREVSSHCQ